MNLSFRLLSLLRGRGGFYSFLFCALPFFHTDCSAEFVPQGATKSSEKLSITTLEVCIEPSILFHGSQGTGCDSGFNRRA